MLTIRPAERAEADWLTREFVASLGWTKPAGYFQSVIERQARGELTLLLALKENTYLGHCAVVWRSAYSGFRDAGIPEIQDLNVRRDSRQRGIGSALLDEAERRIAERSGRAGIAVGLYADYGAAQRLYTKRGYLPDGRGLHYRRQPVVARETYRVDDDLLLYLLKRL